MREMRWELGIDAQCDDRAMADLIAQGFVGIYDRHLRRDDGANHALPIETRASRRTEGWFVTLVLTPWMLARVFVALRDPGLPVPAGWSAEERAAAPYVVIGPAVELPLLGATQRAHLNHDGALGHYLVQPLVQSLAKFDSADAVFESWNEVIATRARVMDEQKRDCPWQRDISRREFFSRLGNRRS